MRPLVVVGGGGFGRETLDVVEAVNADRPAWDVIGVIDDGPSDLARDRLAARDVAFLGGTQWLTGKDSVHVVIAVGSPSTRVALAALVERAGHTPTTVIHPGATIGTSCEIGEGTVICGGVQISTNVSIGRFAHINPGAIVGHDARLDDFVSVNPGAIISGETFIESQVLIGAGAVVLQGLTVGTGSTVGAAACVTKSVPREVTALGVPARVRGPN